MQVYLTVLEVEIILNCTKSQDYGIHVKGGSVLNTCSRRIH